MNKTAKENYYILFDDIVSLENDALQKCPAHGSVNYGFAMLIDNEGMDDQRIKIGAGKKDDLALSISKADYYKDGEGMNGAIFATGREYLTNTLNVTVYDPWSGYIQYGKTGRGDYFSNLDYTSKIVTNNQTITVKNFNDDGDRINLQNTLTRNDLIFGNRTFNMKYWMTGATINRRVECSGVACPASHELGELKVEGNKAANILGTDLVLAQQNGRGAGLFVMR
ncbi:MAG: hypothetical protein WCK98_07510 [bacterium]